MTYEENVLSRFLNWRPDEDWFDDETPHEPIESDFSEPTERPLAYWHWNFVHNQYDWSDPEFLKQSTGPHAYRVVPLTQGYFMIVSPHDYQRMTRFPDGTPKRWQVNIQRDARSGEITGVYARRWGRGDEPTCVYAHRELIGCLDSNGIVDHLNGWGLDNRRGTQEHPVNLRYTSRSANMHNALRTRVSNSGLPRGVELRRKNRRGRQLYGGMYCKRFGTKVKTVRSKRVWLTPGPAAQWYQKQMEKLNERRTAWAHNPESVNFPVFPPCWDVPF
ncbi:MAG TPA: hypothetical protein VF696_00360 [Candidatus Paceibacterota bacterium]|jgi:hypothetical protein